MRRHSGTRRRHFPWLSTCNIIRLRIIDKPPSAPKLRALLSIVSRSSSVSATASIQHKAIAPILIAYGGLRLFIVDLLTDLSPRATCRAPASDPGVLSRPVVAWSIPRSPSVSSAQPSTRRRESARGPVSVQQRRVHLPRVPAHNAPHYHLCFRCYSTAADPVSFPLGIYQRVQHPPEDHLFNLNIDQPPTARHPSALRRHLVKHAADSLSKAHQFNSRRRQPPPRSRLHAKTDAHHAQVPVRRHTPPTDPFTVQLRPLPPDQRIDADPVAHTIHFILERRAAPRYPLASTATRPSAETCPSPWRHLRNHHTPNPLQRIYRSPTTPTTLSWGDYASDS